MSSGVFVRWCLFIFCCSKLSLGRFLFKGKADEEIYFFTPFNGGTTCDCGGITPWGYSGKLQKIGRSSRSRSRRWWYKKIGPVSIEALIHGIHVHDYVCMYASEYVLSIQHVLERMCDHDTTLEIVLQLTFTPQQCLYISSLRVLQRIGGKHDNLRLTATSIPPLVHVRGGEKNVLQQRTVPVPKVNVFGMCQSCVYVLQCTIARLRWRVVTNHILNYMIYLVSMCASTRWRWQRDNLLLTAGFMPPFVCDCADGKSELHAVSLWHTRI